MLGRVLGEDRFYIPGKNQTASDKSDEFETSSTDKHSVVSHSNLDRFLESTTPCVPAQDSSKPYFLLSDLWESFKEWSAYGAGVPLLLDGRDCCVVQYYVPYLSAIQLYGPINNSNDKPRWIMGDDSDGDDYSDKSSDCEIKKGINFSKNNMDGQGSEQEGFSSDDGDSRGSLLFEYLEREPPYCREPLAGKIKDLAQQFPALKTLRSCDLLPLSWISVAWYPIYRIPTGPTLKDLEACFLTYHALSTPIGGDGEEQSPLMVYPPSEIESFPKIRLPVSGMATYKLKGSMWTHSGVSERQMANSLMQAADNWLRLLEVHHPDFHFFASHGMYSR